MGNLEQKTDELVELPVYSGRPSPYPNFDLGVIELYSGFTFNSRRLTGSWHNQRIGTSDIQAFNLRQYFLKMKGNRREIRAVTK